MTNNNNNESSSDNDNVVESGASATLDSGSDSDDVAPTRAARHTDSVVIQKVVAMRAQQHNHAGETPPAATAAPEAASSPPQSDIQALEQQLEQLQGQLQQHQQQQQEQLQVEVPPIVRADAPGAVQVGGGQEDDAKRKMDKELLERKNSKDEDDLEAAAVSRAITDSVGETALEAAAPSAATTPAQQEEPATVTAHAVESDIEKAQIRQEIIQSAPKAELVTEQEAQDKEDSNKKSNRNILIGIGLLLLVFVIAIVAVLVLNGGDGDDEQVVSNTSPTNGNDGQPPPPQEEVADPNNPDHQCPCSWDVVAFQEEPGHFDNDFNATQVDLDAKIAVCGPSFVHEDDANLPRGEFGGGICKSCSGEVDPTAPPNELACFLTRKTMDGTLVFSSTSSFFIDNTFAEADCLRTLGRYCSGPPPGGAGPPGGGGGGPPGGGGGGGGPPPQGGGGGGPPPQGGSGGPPPPGGR